MVETDKQARKRLAGEVTLEELNTHIEVTEAMQAGAIARNNVVLEGR